VRVDDRDPVQLVSDDGVAPAAEHVIDGGTVPTV
jgi:hypothetical protein